MWWESAVRHPDGDVLAVKQASQEPRVDAGDGRFLPGLHRGRRDAGRMARSLLVAAAAGRAGRGRSPPVNGVAPRSTGRRASGAARGPASTERTALNTSWSAKHQGCSIAVISKAPLVEMEAALGPEVRRPPMSIREGLAHVRDHPPSEVAAQENQARTRCMAVGSPSPSPAAPPTRGRIGPACPRLPRLDSEMRARSAPRATG